VKQVIVAVALVAVVLFAERTRRRWAFFRKRADYHAGVERGLRWLVDGTGTMSGGDVLELHANEVDDPEPPLERSRYSDVSVFLRDSADRHARMRRYWRSRW
jgi:hypothetical protein